MASNWYLAPLFHVTLALLLVSSTVACSCVNPPFLSECDVGDGEAALLVSVICQKTMQCGSFSASGISDVTIDLVLPSNGTTANGARRRLSSFTVPGGCDWFEAPLTTTLCSGNIRQPTEGQVRELADGCLNPLQD